MTEELFPYYPFYSLSYWEDFYSKGVISYDWYFNLENFNSAKFNIDSWDREAEILILGVGSSTITDYLISKQFLHVTLVDFSPKLISFLKQKYEHMKECEEWTCI